MALTPDVTAGTLIQSAWGNEIRDRTVQSFANPTDRDAWTDAPRGALAVTVDTNTVWLYDGTGWEEFRPPSAAATAPHARVYAVASQTIQPQTLTAVKFDQQRVNVGNMHSTVTNNSRFTIGTEGWYSIGACVAFGNPTSGSREVAVQLNGNTHIAGLNKGPVTQPRLGSSFLTVGTEYQLAAGDYVEITVYTEDTARALPNHLDQAPEAWVTWRMP